MLAYVVTLSILWHSPTPIQFYYVGEERYKEFGIEACMAAGEQKANSIAVHIVRQHYKHLPKIKFKVDCIVPNVES